MEYFGFPMDIIPPLVPTFGEQGRLTDSAAKELGLKAGTPVTYRAGDQPNNALSLRVLHPGEIAATAGTSGVVYGIEKWEIREDNGKIKGDRGQYQSICPLSSASEARYLLISSPISSSKVRPINTFLHVNGNLGLMHCINGCGILNSWLRHNVAADLGWTAGFQPASAHNNNVYDQMNNLAATVPVGSEGVCIIPFGNGAERVLGNKDIGASIHGLNFNRHTRAHLLRAAQEGIAFAFMYGMEQMDCLNVVLPKCLSADAANTQTIKQSSNQTFKTIHAGRANMFLSPIFRDTLASLSGATIHLYDTDGSVGAARGAGLGAGIYSSEDEAFASLHRLAVIEPRADMAAPLAEAYLHWKETLNNIIQ